MVFDVSTNVADILFVSWLETDFLLFLYLRSRGVQGTRRPHLLREPKGYKIQGHHTSLSFLALLTEGTRFRVWDLHLEDSATPGDRHPGPEAGNSVALASLQPVFASGHGQMGAGRAEEVPRRLDHALRRRACGAGRGARAPALGAGTLSDRVRSVQNIFDFGGSGYKICSMTPHARGRSRLGTRYKETTPPQRAQGVQDSRSLHLPEPDPPGTQVQE